MNRKDLIIISAILFIIFNYLSFCEGVNETMADRYFPIAPGNYWKYRKTEKVAPSLTYEAVYHDIENRSSNTDLPMETSYGQTVSIISADRYEHITIVTANQLDDKGNFTLFYIFKENKMFIIPSSTIDINSLLESGEIPSEFLPDFLFPLHDGQREEIVVDPINDIKCIYSVEKVGDVTVTAGTFKEVLVVNLDTMDGTTKSWVAPDIGIIKQEYQSKDNTVYVLYELVEYKIMP